MKKHITTFILVTVLSQYLFAQNNSSGIYKTWQDYKANKLSITCNCNSSDKIKLHHFFSKNYIDVIEGGNKFRLYKDNIFGYRDCKQNDYRFYKEGDKEYKIIRINSTFTVMMLG